MQCQKHSVESAFISSPLSHPPQPPRREAAAHSSLPPRLVITNSHLCYITVIQVTTAEMQGVVYIRESLGAVKATSGIGPVSCRLDASLHYWLEKVSSIDWRLVHLELC